MIKKEKKKKSNYLFSFSIHNNIASSIAFEYQPVLKSILLEAILRKFKSMSLLMLIVTRLLRVIQIDCAYWLINASVFFQGSLAKMEIGLAKGKKLHDKRDDLAKKDQKREMERASKIKY